ncbi:MAG: DsbA family oxidoreductase [Geminicoccaceae bacterium]
MSAPEAPLNRVSPALMPASRSQPLPVVELVADISCPWCYIGFRRLRALQQRQPLRMAWRPFLLNPAMPAEGVDRRAYRLRKFGSIEASRRLDRRVVEVGAEDGIAFALERIQRTPRTVPAHMLLLQAQPRGLLEMMAERLFAAYFVQGRDIGDPRELQREAAALGLDWAPERDREAREAAVMASHDEACAQGVSGVPLFLFRPGLSVAGAQPPETLAAVLDLARLRQQLEAASDQGRQAS